MGSSLPVQGQQTHRPWHRGNNGFIPAGAGATGNLAVGCPLSGVHPCRCRGNGGDLVGHGLGQGSSLPVQGQLSRVLAALIRVGFIPAGAGATSAAALVSGISRVHPCRCRGNSRATWRAGRSGGSSLPVQGQLPYARVPSLFLGFIPAGAGATLSTVAVNE